MSIRCPYYVVSIFVVISCKVCCNFCFHTCYRCIHFCCKRFYYCWRKTCCCPEKCCKRKYRQLLKKIKVLKFEPSLQVILPWNFICWRDLSRELVFETKRLRNKAVPMAHFNIIGSQNVLAWWWLHCVNAFLWMKRLLVFLHNIEQISECLTLFYR